MINNEVIINPEINVNKEAFISPENLFSQNENQYKDNYLIDVTNGIKIDQRDHENKDDSLLVRSSIEMQSLRLWDIQDFDVTNEIQFTGELSNISDSSESTAELKNENIRKSY